MELWIDDLKPHFNTVYEFEIFVHKLAARIMVGEQRYGLPKRKNKYLTRLGMELKVYQRTGNAEHLLNIANYCILEMIAPEHKKHHSDNTVESETRGRV